MFDGNKSELYQSDGWRPGNRRQGSSSRGGTEMSSGVRSQESGVRSQESGVRSQESGVRSKKGSETRSERLRIFRRHTDLFLDSVISDS